MSLASILLLTDWEATELPRTRRMEQRFNAHDTDWFLAFADEAGSFRLRLCREPCLINQGETYEKRFTKHGSGIARFC
jgi:hypothetical protein